MRELIHHRFKDGTVIAVFHDPDGGRFPYSISGFDRSDIEQWSMEFEYEHEAFTEFNKRVQQGPVDQRAKP